MDADVIPFGNMIDRAELDVPSTLQRVLLGGHAIRTFTAYEAGKLHRNTDILFKPDLSPIVPVLGHGRGTNAEQAIVRSLYTYAQSLAPGGQPYDKYVEARRGRIDPPLDGRSQLDHIVEGNGEVWLYQDEELLVAVSTSGGGPNGDEAFKATGTDAIDAIENLVDGYNFDTDDIEYFENLPRTLFR